MKWFPTDVVDIPNDASNLIRNKYLDTFENKTCTGSESGRFVKLHDTTYEVSLCDLMDLNLDIVYHSADNAIYWRQDGTSTLTYACISVLSVLLVSSMAHNIIREAHHTRLHDPWYKRPQAWCVALSAVFVAYWCLSEKWWNTFIYRDDQRLFVAVSIFTAVRIVNLLMQGWKFDKNNFSLLTACLLLMTARIHFSFDNPYILPLTLVFLVRTFVKFFSLMRLPTIAPSHMFMFSVDAVTGVMLCNNAVRLSQVRIIDSFLQQFYIVYASFWLAAIMSIYTSAATPPAPP
jgi:hypothetical protein